jgi:hypothetical protein
MARVFTLAGYADDLSPSKLLAFFYSICLEQISITTAEIEDYETSHEKYFSQRKDDYFGEFSRIIFGTGYVAIEKQIINT